MLSADCYSGGVRDDMELDEALDVPSQDVRGSKDDMDAKLKG